MENNARGREVYSPDEWYSLVRWANVNGEPYNVIEKKVKKFVVSSDNYELLEFKYSFKDNETKKIQCFKNISTRLSLFEHFPAKAYNALLKINVAKYKDLKCYYDNNIMPEKCYTFYRNLLTTEYDKEDWSDDDV